MFKAFLISLTIVCCGAQLDISRLKLATLGSPYAVQSGLAAANWGGQWGGLQRVGAHVFNPIHAIRTQEILPVQDLDVSGGPNGLFDVRGDQQPVLLRFQTHGAPVHVETSHIPSPPQETTVTQVHDEPHRVIHEVIRPVIQEVREIIQPYRRVTQEIRPVQEEVHTEVAAGAPAVANAAVAVAAPVPTIVRAEAPALVSAPAQAVYGSQLLSSPVDQNVAQRNWGVIPFPEPLLTGSYIQSFLDQIRARQTQSPIALSQSSAIAVEPVVSEAIAVQPVGQVVGPQKLVAQNRGSLQFTRKYVEY